MVLFVLTAVDPSSILSIKTLENTQSYVASLLFLIIKQQKADFRRSSSGVTSSILRCDNDHESLPSFKKRKRKERRVVMMTMAVWKEEADMKPKSSCILIPLRCKSRFISAKSKFDLVLYFYLKTNRLHR